MTNLKLPSMSYDALAEVAPENGRWRKIAYKTFVKREQHEGCNVVVSVRHHNSTIAEISPTKVLLNSHGWDTQTTAHRMDRILWENNTGVRLGVRKRALTVLDGTTFKEMYPLPDGRAIFYR